METTFRLDTAELSADFLDSVKALFRNQKVEITVRSIDLPDADWKKALTANPAFEFLHDEAEEIYSLADGKAVSDEV